MSTHTHTHTCTHTHTLEYYSAMRKKEVLPFVTTWMGFEGIILTEISQTKANIVMISISYGI